MRSQVICLLLLLSLCSAGIAQAESPQPLDKALDACIEKDSSTLGMKICHQKFSKKWDVLLNKTYLELGGDKNHELKESQMAWINFRDQEYRWIEKKYQRIYEHSGGGTIWAMLAGHEKMEVIRSRVLKLIADEKLLRCGMAC